VQARAARGVDRAQVDTAHVAVALVARDDHLPVRELADDGAGQLHRVEELAVRGHAVQERTALLDADDLAALDVGPPHEPVEVEQVAGGGRPGGDRGAPHDPAVGGDLEQVAPARERVEQVDGAVLVDLDEVRAEGLGALVGRQRDRRGGGPLAGAQVVPRHGVGRVLTLEHERAAARQPERHGLRARDGHDVVHDRAHAAEVGLLDPVLGDGVEHGEPADRDRARRGDRRDRRQRGAALPVRRGPRTAAGPGDQAHHHQHEEDGDGGGRGRAPPRPRARALPGRGAVVVRHHGRP
jgi:hypothetical protein